MKNKKRCVYLFIMILIFCTFLVYSEEAKNEEKTSSEMDTLIDSFLNSDLKESPEVISAINANREEFLKAFSEKINMPALSGDIAKSITKVDENGNLIFDNNQKVSLFELKKYSEVITDPEKAKTYSLEGEDFPILRPNIKELKVDGDSLVYSFENGAKISIKGETKLDLENHVFTTTGGKKIELLGGYNGEVIVDGDSFESKVNIDDSSGDVELKNFAILKTEDGTIFSPNHKIVSDVKAPEDIDVKGIGDGKYRIFEKDGKKYSVDNNGQVKEIMDFKYKDNGDDAPVASNALVQKEGFGKILVGEDVAVYLGQEPPGDVQGNYVYIGELVDGKRDVSIRCLNGETVYKLDSDVGQLKLDGNVILFNGDVAILSDTNGHLFFRKLDGKGEFEFAVDSLFNVNKPDMEFHIKYGNTISDVIGFAMLDITGLTTGHGGASAQQILSSAAFQQLAGGLEQGQRDSLALSIARNLDRLGLAYSEENIGSLTSQILRAQSLFGDRVLIGGSLEKLIYVTNSEDGGTRFNPPEVISEFLLKTGLTQDQLKHYFDGQESAALAELASSTGATTFLFSGHGYARGMSTGGGDIGYDEIVNALATRYAREGRINDITIISHACTQYDCMRNIAEGLAQRGIGDFPILISEANMGVSSWTEYEAFGNDYNFQEYRNANWLVGGGEFTGAQFLIAENGLVRAGSSDDPAVFFPAKVIYPDGIERAVSLEIS